MHVWRDGERASGSPLHALHYFGSLSPEFRHYHSSIGVTLIVMSE